MAGLYVHIPFCRAKCRYCDFASAAAGRDFAETESRYLDALAAEAVARSVGWKEFDTVYIGGGTPGVLSAAALERLFVLLKSNFDLSAASEITVECNPESADFAKLDVLTRLGANRLSMGAQSFDEETLKYLGRVHPAMSVRESFAAAREAGFDNIGLDLIFGAPVGGPETSAMESRLEKWRCDLDNAVALKPEHISVYALSIEDGTPLAASGDIISEDEQADMYALAREHLSSAGYVHYELSNFARPGRESRHNLNYWRLGSYLGLGAAAASFDGRSRFKNTSDTAVYTDNPADSAAERETLTGGQIASEKIFLGLRLLNEGVTFGAEESRLYADVLSRLEADGSVERRGAAFRLRPSAYFTSNAVMREFV
ncbi:MAG: coproporphyrinogen III oxidase [Elusimicrobia bacterium HGW-Elusimicrobia-1]|jgi:oxygen-independent coproporphyrinogen-3 oxidase|nr:MAG: coproporphyrinogen III oxidase [Elusimicrobia bacterium HGW-Elusimicrobia-1]